VARQKLGFWYRFAVGALKPPVILLTRRRWLNQELLPSSGGFVVAPNHTSHFDPIAVAHYLYDNGRAPRFLAKDELFDVPLVGHIVDHAGQIPVHRETGAASDAMRDAIAAVRAGECVVCYPEGTLTRDPNLWPMRGKTGAARIALATGCPVIPMAHWGAHRVLAPYGRKPHVFPPQTVSVTVGPPVDLSDLMGQEQTAEVLQEATDRIMDAITALVAELRDEVPPAERLDPRAAGLPEIGKADVHYDDPDRRSS
jgi:1-acyl-sn-glycerol-3-phosphate acyltransferase